MANWQYKKLMVDILEVSADDFDAKLNKFGDDGWELVTMFDRERGGNSKECFFVFKKPR